jgi:methylated-DNA-protein-cysteine methyltransferase-like protein
MESSKSAYELARDETIKRNQAELQRLGLEPLSTRKKSGKRKQPPQPKDSGAPMRASKRVHSAKPDYTGESIDTFGNNAARLQPPESAKFTTTASSSSSSSSDTTMPSSSTTKQSQAASAVIEGVRAYLEDHVPDGWAMEEKTMFGMNMWMVRGNMFLGVGFKSQRLLVRVGEENVETILADSQAKHEKDAAGVARCGTPGGRSFPGTLMVELPQYKGQLLRRWFDLAIAHNASMEAKESFDKPRRKKNRCTEVKAAKALATPAASRDEEEELGVQDEAAPPAEEVHAPPPPPLPRPASTSGGAFARCVLHVIKQIPYGQTASYGQIAALAGAPRNARQVGHMLKEGLARGGVVPWYRVINSAGRISLPLHGGGDTQRERLEAEGVRFNAQTGAVAPGTFWSRAAPFFE